MPQPPKGLQNRILEATEARLKGKALANESDDPYDVDIRRDGRVRQQDSSLIMLQPGPTEFDGESQCSPDTRMISIFIMILRRAENDAVLAHVTDMIDAIVTEFMGAPTDGAVLRAQLSTDAYRGDNAYEGFSVGELTLEMMR